MSKVVLSIILIVIVAALLMIMLIGIGGCGFAAVGCGAMDWGWQFNGNLPSGAEHGLEYEQPLSAVDAVTLDFVGENINVVTYSGNTVRVEQTGSGIKENDMMRFGMMGNTLVAESGKVKLWSFGKSSRSTVTLYLPENSAVKLEVSTVSGDMSVDGGSYEALDMDSASGNLSAVAQVENGFKGETVSGNISFDGSAKTVDAESMSGEIDIAAGGLERAKLESVSGNAGIACGEADALKQVKIDTVSGDVGVELPVGTGFELSFDTVSGDEKNSVEMTGNVHGDGQVDLDVDTLSGNLTLSEK